MQINDGDLFLAVKYVKVSRLEWNSNLTCNTTYCMYIPSFKLISQNMYKKARKTSKNPKRAKIIAKILKIIFLQKTELMSRNIQQATCVSNLKNLSWFMRPWLQKKRVWPTFGCKLGQNDPIVIQLKLDMSCHLLNVYTKCQIDISKHVEEKSGKRGRTDGQTDGRTLPRHNTSRFSNGRIKRCDGRTDGQTDGLNHS